MSLEAAAQGLGLVWITSHPQVCLFQRWVNKGLLAALHLVAGSARKKTTKVDETIIVITISIILISIVNIRDARHVSFTRIR